MDVIEFFQLSTGKWRSQRTTRQLAFQLSETGESEIQVEVLEADHLTQNPPLIQTTSQPLNKIKFA